VRGVPVAEDVGGGAGWSVVSRYLIARIHDKSHRHGWDVSGSAATAHSLHHSPDTTFSAYSILTPDANRRNGT